MKRLFILLSAAIVFAFSGCAMVNSPATGFWYTDVNWDSGVANPGITAEKEGKACLSTILGLIATGDASIAAAKEAGDITKVSHVDHYSKSVLGFYAKYCTIVRGE